MGNQACCDVRNTEYKEKYPEDNSEIKEIKQENANQVERNEGPSEPKQEQNTNEEHGLSAETRQRLSHYKSQEEARIGPDAKRRVFGKQTYVGQLDSSSRPSGYGKIYKRDGSVYLGEWSEGKAHGHGVYVTNDGSFYEGNFNKNKAEGQGHFFSGSYQYEGHFRNNKYHGIGTERCNKFRFHGQFDEGKKLKGTMTWKDQQNNQEENCAYEYVGQFNADGKFEGKGKLSQPNGVYEGDFKDGEKHGKGTYKFSNGLKYQGDYLNGKKEGQGAIINCNDSIAYEGEFADDIPHGVGYIRDAKGNKMKRRWIRGIDSEGIDE